jgi:hypothetical protein
MGHLSLKTVPHELRARTTFHCIPTGSFGRGKTGVFFTQPKGNSKPASHSPTLSFKVSNNGGSILGNTRADDLIKFWVSVQLVRNINLIPDI